jgi:3-hydroxybutyryl-CoA dehydrogenase
MNMNIEFIKEVGIVGAGLMGHGIALQCAISGYPVKLVDTSDMKLQSAIQNIKTTIELLNKMHKTEDLDEDQILNRISVGTDINIFYDVDYLIEAVYEDLELKRGLLQSISAKVSDHTILASNTSSFVPSQFDFLMAKPDRVIVANWWNPPYLIPLVEVVPGPNTSKFSIEVTKEFLKKINKKPVVLNKESMGFIGNRLQFALLREAISLVEKGVASAEDIDEVVKSGFGRRLAIAGPFQVFDLAGWDTISTIMEELFPVLENTSEVSDVVKKKVIDGHLGVKASKGFYSWDKDVVTKFRESIVQKLSDIDNL